MGDTGTQMEYEGFDKRLPALMDGDTVLLPEVALPLPLGGRSPNPGRDGEDDWADYTAGVLIPRWAVECIREGLIWGQELEADCDESGHSPIETLKARGDAIVRSPGEMDKWTRIVGWGIDAVRNLNLEQANKWHGGLVELLELGDVKSVPLGLRLAFSQKMGAFVAAYYWDSWAREGWPIVERCFRRGGELDDSDRKKAERLVAEGQSYWNRDPLTGQPMVLPDVMSNGHCFLGEKRWLNSGVNQMIKCLTELPVPKEKRELDMKTIWLLFRSHAGCLATFKAKEEDGVAYSVEREASRARAEARVLNAEALTAKAMAKMYQAQNNEEKARKAKDKAEKKLQKARKWKIIAEERGRQLKELKSGIEEARKSADEARQESKRTRLAVQKEKREVANYEDWIFGYNEFESMTSGPDAIPYGDAIDILFHPEGKYAKRQFGAKSTFKRRYDRWRNELGSEQDPEQYRLKLKGNKRQRNAESKRKAARKRPS